MAGTDESMVFLAGREQEDAHVDLPATAQPCAEELTITENSALGIYEAALGGEIVAGVIYSKAFNRVALLATSVFPAFRGKGIPAKVLIGVLEKLRGQGVTVTISCPFAAEFVGTRPEYADVLVLAVSGNGTIGRGQ
jgi:predicted GNAT family acetyltransferase